MRNIRMIILHCSATKEGQNIKARDIDRWHRQRGFASIGYHYVIDLDGTIEKGRGEEQVGAHCVGRNTESIGICYVGGLDADGKPKDTRTDAQKAAMVSLVKKLMKKYGLNTGALHGHYEFAAKACPCFKIGTLVKELSGE